MPTRRTFLGGAASAALLPSFASAQGTVLPDWQSFAGAYRTPDWFRDAKFGIWSHWGPQCVPEFGDWYGRLMYVQGSRFHDHHAATYGHPSEAGFMELIGRWRADAWEPEELTRLFRRAGAKYVMSMASHHDNFDNFDSAHHEWNATRVGPRRDIVGTWEKAVREAGLRFGVSNHSSHAWHWWQTAYGYDAEGPLRGRRYDAHWLRREHGRGKWWEGLDPQELYTGPTFAPPDGIRSIEEMDAWHAERDGQWMEHAPPQNPAFVRKWLLRQKDLVEKYRPDIVYFDNYGIPFGQTGLDAVAHYYNQSLGRHGDIDVVLTANRLEPHQRLGLVENVERGFLDEIRPLPWQTATCIGQWHYDRPLYERHGYKSAKEVIQRLADIVSKNGNLLLSIPQRGDGSIDDDELAILDDFASWFAVNGEAIHGTRPWRTFGEGPTRPPTGHQSEGGAQPFTAADIRFTAKGDTLYAILLDWPEGETAIGSLGAHALSGGAIERVALLGGPDLDFRQGADALRLQLPRPAAGAFVPALRIEGRGLV
jgi:alpha-L-fucosidase